MKKVRFCVLSLLLLPALLLPTSANSAPTRYGGIGGSVLEIQEDCPSQSPRNSSPLTYRSGTAYSSPPKSPPYIK